MSPTLNNGDFILAIKLPKAMYRTNDIVVVNHPKFNNIIKRIDLINSGFLRLKGDGKDTLSTAKMGDIATACILGKMIWHISPNSKNE